MKDLLFSFFIMIHICVSAQSYAPLLDNRNEWQLISCYEGDCFRDAYYTDGDTIVNGQNHKILDSYHYISRTFLLHENIQDKKVFLTTTINGHVKQQLLYDFNLEEGDSINLFNPITPFPEDGGYFQLDSIRMKPIYQGEAGKYFYFSPKPSNTVSQGYFPVWVEGLGSLSIINAPGGNPDYNGVGQVSCFFKNNDLFYFDDRMTDECESIMSTKPISDKNSDLQFAVQGQKGILKTKNPVSKIEIYDLSGIKHFSQIKLKRGISELNLNDLKKGVYFLLCYDEQNITRISFILK